MRTVISLFASLLVIPVLALAEDDPDAVMAEIRAAHAERVDKIKMLRMAWEGEEMWTSKEFPGLEAEPTSMKANSLGILITSGPSRYSRETGKSLEPVPIPYEHTYVDHAGRNLRIQTRGPIGPYPAHASAQISNKRQNYFMDTRLFCDSLTPDPAYLASGSITFLRWESVDGVEMAVLGWRTREDENRHALTQTEYYLDATRDYILVRYVDVPRTFANVKPEKETTIEYVPDPVIGWRPAIMTNTLQGGRVMRTFIVTEFVVNGGIDPAIFAVEFPPGTQVRDEITGAEYVVGETTD